MYTCACLREREKERDVCRLEYCHFSCQVFVYEGGGGAYANFYMQMYMSVCTCIYTCVFEREREICEIEGERFIARVIERIVERVGERVAERDV